MDVNPLPCTLEKSSAASARGSVIDLFCGLGGLSHGFFLEGYKIAVGFDIDESCRFAFETNNAALFVRKSVADLTGQELLAEFQEDEPKILVGCAPCQPFSRYSQGRDDPRWSLLGDFAKLIEEVLPDIVSMENVPRLLQFKDGTVFDEFAHVLRNCGYEIEHTIAYCPDFGVPQSRSRLVLLASRHGRPTLPVPTHHPDNYRTVRDVIAELPPLKAGETDEKDPLHRCSALSTTNLKRIRSSIPGGSWQDWTDNLVTECHKRDTGKGYTSVYGRLKWSEPSPTMTTQFYGFGNGRFGHPEQDRAISLREGAIFQTFPNSYAFTETSSSVHMKTLGRLIGNAVPVELGRAIARAVTEHIREHKL